jgi:hypothetical protein
MNMSFIFFPDLANLPRFANAEKVRGGLDYPPAAGMPFPFWKIGKSTISGKKSFLTRPFVCKAGEVS